MCPRDVKAGTGGGGGRGTKPVGDDPSDPLVAGHETAEVQVGPAARFLVGLGISAALIFFLTFFLYRFWRHAEDRAQPVLPPLVQANHGRLPPEPRLQVTPLIDYQVFRAAQDSILNSYGWANRDSARVRIPIARAMELLVQRGVPARKEMPPVETGIGMTPGGSLGPDGSDRGSQGSTPSSAEPTGRLPRGDLRLRPPAAPVVPVPGSKNDSTHRSGGGR